MVSYFIGVLLTSVGDLFTVLPLHLPEAALTVQPTMALSRVIRSYFRTTPVRSFAKKRKGEDDEEAIDLPELSLERTMQEMHKAIEWLEGQLLNLKVGRSDPRIDEEVIVPSRGFEDSRPSDPPQH
jgi:hypothetical protein